VKATNHLPLLADEKTISWTISKRDLKLWLTENYPVILVIYHATGNRAYWLNVQESFTGSASVELFGPALTVNTKVPTNQRISRRTIQQIARQKRELHLRDRRRLP
jgi:hypothetical protein